MAISSSPISASPIAASGDAALFDGDFISGMIMQSVYPVNTDFAYELSLLAASELLKFPAEFTVFAQVSVFSDFDVFVARTFVSSLQASSALDTRLDGNMTLAAAMRIASTADIAYVLQLMSSMELSGDAELQHAKVLAFLSALMLGDAAVNNVNFAVNLAAAMTLRSMEMYGWDFEAVDAMTMASMFSQRYSTVLDAISSMHLDGVLDSSSQLNMVFIAAASLASAHDTQADLHLDLFDAMVGQVVFKIAEDVYYGIVLSTEAVAFTEYTQYPFNSFFTYQGKPYGVADDGIYLLEGDDDAGEPIEAAFKSKLTTMRQRALKDARGLYLGYTSSGELVLKVTTIENGQKREDWYKAQYSGDLDFRQNRMKIQRGLRSTYWQFEIANVDGSDFEVEDVTILYEVLSRRIR